MTTDPTDIGRPVVSVELAIVTVVDGELRVLLDRRTEHPFKGTWALPGGFVRVSESRRQGESLNDSALRVLQERTGLSTGTCHIEQLHTFGRAGRDPRTRIISVAWLVGISPTQAANIDKNNAQWSSVSEDVPWLRLAFDHAEIIALGEERVRTALDTSHIAFALVPEAFTVAELRTVYEAILGRDQDARNFRRRFQRMTVDGIVKQAPGKRHLGKSRPAQIWRFAGRHTLR